MPVWGFLAFALATARLTGLVTADALTEPLRDRLLRRLGTVLDPAAAGTTPVLDRLYETHRRRWMIGKLVTCAWCSSMWISAAVVPIAWWHGTNPWALIPALILAASQLAGMVSDIGRG